ncbi:MAG: DNA-packaging protein [Oscillospiraceae bacterium]|nr:DNA-packaging protein [Oscillospiraceae bacterium]
MSKPKFESVDEMQKKIDAYFEDCEGRPMIVDGEPVYDKEGEPIFVGQHPPTVTGLALALGFASRQSLIEYQGKRAFGDTITRAKLRCEEYAERRLYDRDGTRGAEFSLRVNFKWRDSSKDAVVPEGSVAGVVLIPQVMSDGGEAGK